MEKTETSSHLVDSRLRGLATKFHAAGRFAVLAHRILQLEATGA